MYRDRLKEIKEKLHDVCSLGLEGLLCITPSRIHSMYLHDSWNQFRIKILASGRLHKIVNPKEIINVFLHAEDHENNLLSELYLFNFVLPNHTCWNPNPFVGDVQLRAFTSFIYSLVQWRDSK
jgi:hypothetical protein